MAELSSVYKFACRRLAKFSDPDTDYIELADRFTEEDRRAPGFETDMDLSDPAVYLKRRYFNHLAHAGKEIPGPENAERFAVILTRPKTLPAGGTEGGA